MRTGMKGENKNRYAGAKARSPPRVYARVEKEESRKATGSTRALLGEESR